MRKVMTDAMFNEMLDHECREVGSFYLQKTHYQPYEYVRVAGDGPNSTVISYVETVAKVSNLAVLLRKFGAAAALDHAILDPLAIFVVAAQYGVRTDVLAPQQPFPVITITGVTNDGRYNMAILPAQFDEDGRVYALPSDVCHWSENPNFKIDLMTHLEFFRISDQIRQKVAA